MLLTRLLCGYERNGDELRGQVTLPSDVDLHFLQELFGADKSEPMFDCFPLDIEKAGVLEASFNLPRLDPTLEWFLECDLGPGSGLGVDPDIRVRTPNN